MVLRTRYRKIFAVAALILLLGVISLATLYFTQFDLPWIAFLAGVLLSAAVAAALMSRTGKAQSLDTRRDLEIEPGTGGSAPEDAERARCARKLKNAEARFRLVTDALPVMIVFVDREERCRYHNRAFRHWCARNSERINGLPLREVVGAAIYHELWSHSSEVLAGKELRYDTAWPRQDGGNENMAVTLLPYPAGLKRKIGYYALIARAPASAEAPPSTADKAVGDKAVGDVVVVSREDGETLYLESMAEQLISNGDPRERLVQALRKDQFILFAQKIESIAPGSEHGQYLEVLVRLQEEEEHLLPPGSFFPVAERYHLLGEIDRWVVHNLLKWSAARQRDDPAWLMPLCCVNLSSTSLCDPAFASYVQSELKHSNISGKGLCFELAELDLIRHHHNVQALMSLLRPLGCRFTVEAFVGSDEVSFAPFKDLKLDFLKIDGIIIQNILTDSFALAKTKAIVLACQQLGVRTIAELVETEATVAQLRKIGVDYIQGFGISRPAPLAQLA